MSFVKSLENSDNVFSDEVMAQAIDGIESGYVVYFPHMPFHLLKEEGALLTPDLVGDGVKNISYKPDLGLLKGMRASPAEQNQMAQMMHRFSNYATELVAALLPYYQGKIQAGKTSFRPVEVLGRPSSYRKDDTRLHVDAFPSTPIQGKRILRVFSNVNPHGQARHWRLGEAFSQVAQKFLPQISKPVWGVNHVWSALGITKGVRTDYDYYMNQIHNRMKKDMSYQNNVPQEEFFFAPGTTWMVMTDQASHAAMAGQYVLEQTFYLPVGAMKAPEKSPLRVLERMVGRKLA